MLPAQWIARDEKIEVVSADTRPPQNTQMHGAFLRKTSWASPSAATLRRRHRPGGDGAVRPNRRRIASPENCTATCQELGARPFHPTDVTLSRCSGLRSFFCWVLGAVAGLVAAVAVDSPAAGHRPGGRPGGAMAHAHSLRTQHFARCRSAGRNRSASQPGLSRRGTDPL